MFWQVHRAQLLDGTEVAMKIQYPGVADSVESDLKNLQRLVQLTNILPPGLYIDEIIKVRVMRYTSLSLSLSLEEEMRHHHDRTYIQHVLLCCCVDGATKLTDTS